MYFLLTNFFPGDTPLSLISYVIRIPVVILSSFEFVRIVTLLLMYFTIQLQVISSVVDQFHSIRGRMILPWGNVRLRALYVGLGIAIEFSSGVQGPTTAALMALSQMLAAICIIATIRMRGVIPMPLYLIFPTIAVFVPILVLMLLPRASNCYDKSVILLLSWRDVTSWDCARKGGMCESRARKKATGALRPYRVYASMAGVKLYMMKRSTKATFLHSCMDATVTGFFTFQ